MEGTQPVGISAKALIATPLVALFAIGSISVTQVYTHSSLSGAPVAIGIGVFFLATLVEVVILPAALYALTVNPGVRSWQQGVGVALGLLYLALFIVAFFSGGI